MFYVWQSVTSNLLSQIGIYGDQIAIGTTLANWSGFVKA